MLRGEFALVQDRGFEFLDVLARAAATAPVRRQMMQRNTSARPCSSRVAPATGISVLSGKIGMSVGL